MSEKSEVVHFVSFVNDQACTLIANTDQNDLAMAFGDFRKLCVALMSSILLGCSANPLAGAIRATAEDTEIVEATAIDFLDSGDCTEGTGGDRIVVEDKTLSASLVFSWLRLDDLPPDIWHDDLESGLPSLRERNDREDTVDWHFANDARISDVVLKGFARSATEKAASLGKCVATFARPGVYANGNRATVVFEISPEYHGRFAISSLHRVGGVWRVERRHTFEYL